MLREFPVPAGHTDAARAWLDAEGRSGHRPFAAGPRPAATVLLVRDGDRGVEVFMIRRVTGMAFAGGMFAFPGGGVDPRDSAGDVPWAGPDAATWASWLGVPEERARAVVCAAVRETFEECGVMLADGEGLDPEEAQAEWPGSADERADDDRRRLLSREIALSDLLRERTGVLRSDLLRPWAHWTTPLHEPRRYDTHFLLAAAPPGQHARHVGGEASESDWWPAAELLRAWRSREIAMLPPTLVAVEELAAAPDVATLLAAPRTVREVVPELRRRGDVMVLVADLPEQPQASADGEARS